jgi:hypothetical protein
VSETEFYCAVEHHLGRFGIVLAVYLLAYRVSKKSEQFSASAESVATFLGVRRETVARAFKTLVALGFFILLESGKSRFEPNVYYVVSHKLWADAHSGQCCEKTAFPWSDGDRLGRDLHALSASRIRFKDFQLANYRKLGFDDSEIVESFKSFLKSKNSASGKRTWRKSAAVEFWKHLQANANARVSSSAV